MICRAFSYIRQLEDENKLGILKIAETIDERDAYTYQHSKRVAEFTEKIAKKIHLSSVQVEQLVTAARLHDLGKMGVKDDVLHKPGKLDKAEWDVMRRHPEIGAKIVGHYHLHKESVDCVLYHHERYDGKGYPHGLKGEEIPLGARIMAVADSYEAMTSDRPYRKALSQEIAVQQLKEGMGMQFDPMMVAAFLTVLDQEAPSTSPVPTTESVSEEADPASQTATPLCNVHEGKA
jgi:putative nucleotidyltransferase with HDIG domain